MLRDTTVNQAAKNFVYQRVILFVAFQLDLEIKRFLKNLKLMANLNIHALLQEHHHNIYLLHINHLHHLHLDHHLLRELVHQMVV